MVASWWMGVGEREGGINNPSHLDLSSGLNSVLSVPVTIHARVVLRADVVPSGPPP